MQANGHLEGTNHYEEIEPNYFVRHTTYEWKGGPVINIDRGYCDFPTEPKVGQREWIGPYRVRVVEVNPWWGSCMAVRDDSWLRWWYVFRALVERTWFPVRRLAHRLYWEVRLAEWQQGVLPRRKRQKRGGA